MASTMKEIRDWLNENGIKNPVGGEFTYNSVEHMLKNRRYIGELKFRDVVVPDAIPPIVPLELFDDVQEKDCQKQESPCPKKGRGRLPADNQAALWLLRCADVWRKRHKPDGRSPPLL